MKKLFMVYPAFFKAFLGARFESVISEISESCLRNS